MKPPDIATETNLTLAEAVLEYKELRSALRNCPEFGWVKSIENGINSRMDFLRRKIVDFVIGESYGK